jgi:predicted component of type VI protein secretion system
MRVRLRPLEGGQMERLTADNRAIDREDSVVHRWRVSQLTRLGVPGLQAEVYADRIDWHQIARLVRRGCPPELALRIVG